MRRLTLSKYTTQVQVCIRLIFWKSLSLTQWCGIQPFEIFDDLVHALRDRMGNDVFSG